LISSLATDCMAYVFSSLARQKFKLLMDAQKGSEVKKERKEFRYGNDAELEKIREARKTGLSWRELGLMFDRSAYYCQVAVRGKFYKKNKNEISIR